MKISKNSLRKNLFKYIHNNLFITLIYHNFTILQQKTDAIDRNIFKTRLTT